MPENLMYLIAVEPRSGQRFEEALEEGECVVLGRQPKPGSVAELDGCEKVATLTLGVIDGMISRTHAWGVREGNQLRLQRIAPDQGKLTPHPLASLSEPRENLPDVITLSPGQSFGIHREGWFEFHWVADPAEVSCAGADQKKRLEDIPSQEIEVAGYGEEGATAAAVDATGLARDLQILRDDLPEVLSDWGSVEELFSRVAGLLRRSLPAQRKVAVAFLAVEPVMPDSDTVEYIRINRDADSDERGFRPSERMLRDQFLGTSAVRGVPRIKVATHHKVETGGGPSDPPSVSLDYSYDWIATVPVGARRREISSRSASFQPCLYGGRPVCLYIETRESIDLDPEKLLPFLTLVTSLATAVLQADADHQQRLRSESRGAELLARYRAYFSPPLQDRIESRMDDLEGAPALPGWIDKPALLHLRLGAGLAREERLRIMEVVLTAIESGGGVVAEVSSDGLCGLWGWPSVDVEDSPSGVLAALGAIDRIIVELGRKPRGLVGVRMALAAGPLSVAEPRLGVRAAAWFVDGPGREFGRCADGMMAIEGVVVVLDDAARDQLAAIAPARLVRRLGAGRVGGSVEVLHELVTPRALGGTGTSPGQVGIDAESSDIYEKAVEFLINNRHRECVDCLMQLGSDVFGSDGASRHLRDLANELLGAKLDSQGRTSPSTAEETKIFSI